MNKEIVNPYQSGGDERRRVARMDGATARWASARSRGADPRRM